MSDGVTKQTQLVTVNQSNEASAEVDDAGVLLQDNSRKPYMENEEVVEWVNANVAQLLTTVRADYGPIQEQWQKISNMINMEMEENASYKGETQVYLPTFVKALDTRAAHVCKASFPTDSFLDAIATKDETPEEANEREANKAWMKKQIETNAKLRANLKPFVKKCLSFGEGILKVYWEDKLIKQKRKYKSASSDLEAELNKQVQGTNTKGYKRCGKLRVKTVNNFAFYAYPLTVDNLDQCTLVFEDIQISKQFVKTMIAKGYWKKDNITYSAAIPETESHIQRTLSKNTETSNSAVSAGASGDLGEYTMVSECWFSMVLPKSYFTPEEIADFEHLEPQPMKAVICGGNIVDIQDNPFNHGRHPYLMKKLNDEPDVLITPGYGKQAMTSQYFANDLVNQLNDNGIYALNPMLVRNIGAIAGHSLSQKVSPGANWDVTEPNALEFISPDANQIQYGLPLLQMAIGNVNDLIAPPILQGAGTGGTAKTATGTQTLQTNVKTDIQDFNEDMEQQIFTPLLEMAYSLGQQFETEEMYFAITGKNKIKFSPKMLSRDLSWQWVASSQTVNQQLRGQQLINFFTLVANPAVMQMLAQEGIKLKFEPILRMIWEGLGQRSFESLTGPIQNLQQPMLPGQPGITAQPGQSPESMNPAATNPNAVAPVEPGIGNSGEFSGVRDEANGIAALLGEQLSGNPRKSQR